MNRTEWITRSRRLAKAFIQASDAFNALYSELEMTGALMQPEEGGLKPEDFVGEHADIDRDALLAFYWTMGQLLGPLTPEQKRSIYRVQAATQGLPGMGLVL